MARARNLLATDQPLGQIAVACGLSDQAHFTKPFHRETGCSLGVWRRERVAACSSNAEPGRRRHSARTRVK
jgi:AraC-like DNA-binding protein